MNRRKFIKAGTVSSLIGTAFPAQFLEKTGHESAPESIADVFELNELTIDQLQQKMEKAEYTSKKITALYLKRIKAIDQSGFSLKAVIEINPDALLIAEALDKERKDGKIRSPLHGIPVLIKDNIDTADKMKTTAGSLALIDNMAAADAFIVKKLRDAGAVILGKTNLSEWANFRSTRSSSGWSSRGGQTRNPYVLDRSPCGSSSGSAVAVAANLCVIAVGTETDGSVTAPASFCGIVGMKPTVGLLSRSGIIPISQSQDTAGPMAKTVKDAAALLSVMTGIDETDRATISSKGKAPVDYTKLLTKDALNGKRIGIEKSFFSGHEAVVALYKKAVDTMKELGATVIEIELLQETNPLNNAELKVLLYEFKSGLNQYLKKATTNMKSLTDLITFNKKYADKMMPFFAQEIFEQSNASKGLEDEGYADAIKSSKSAATIIAGIMEKHNLDAIAGVTIGPPNCIDCVLGDYNNGFYFCPPAAMAGYPHITVPMGSVHGLPVGFSILAKAYEEQKLFNMAYAYEQATHWRTPPKFLRSIVS